MGIALINIIAAGLLLGGNLKAAGILLLVSASLSFVIEATLYGLKYHSKR